MVDKLMKNYEFSKEYKIVLRKKKMQINVIEYLNIYIIYS